jgi:hypothetical protein
MKKIKLKKRLKKRKRLKRKINHRKSRKTSLNLLFLMKLHLWILLVKKYWMIKRKK